MHYANCKTYNADFDGDEMNMHFCQDELARAEGYFIANADNQYIAPTNGAPLRGLIQDHIVTAIHLTKRDCFFSRSDFQQMVYTACSEAVGFETRPLFTPVPCILKPTFVFSFFLLFLSPFQKIVLLTSLAAPSGPENKSSPLFFVSLPVTFLLFLSLERVRFLRSIGEKAQEKVPFISVTMSSFGEFWRKINLVTLPMGWFMPFMNCTGPILLDAS